ncbi:MAG: nucleoside hydrolase [Bryobacteraceae bacterium]|nr:nucleoside hydrolase [Bryobacteraceae bacterium]
MITRNPRRIILDVDPGIDDALAILLALRSPELRVEAITTVSGNVMVDQGAENARKVAELAGRPDIVVAKGSKYPLMKKPTKAAKVHGEDGLGNVRLPPPARPLDPRHGVDVIAELGLSNPGEITLVAVGPLTNLAMALRKAPELRDAIPEIVLMGGAVAGGNVTPVAEFNIHSDAEAAHIVFESGIPITMVDLGATKQALVTRSHQAALRESGSAMGRTAAAMLDHYLAFEESLGMTGAPLHDPLAVGLAIDETLATAIRPMRIDVETQGDLTYGQTVANRWLRVRTRVDAGDHYVLGEFRRVDANARVPLAIDSGRFLAMFMERIAGGPPGGQA